METRLSLLLKVLLALIGVPILLGIFFFLPAGTLDYWQAWAYLAVLLVPFVFVASYFIITDPKFLERRLKTREKEAQQQVLIKFGWLIFLIGFLLPGFDHRFGWSSIPFEIVIAADVLVFLGYVLVFFVFKENSYAARTVEVEKGQKVITTGPYSIVRHPMYVGMLLMYLSTPIALGSYYSLLVFAFIVPMIIYRILNEEKVLLRGLPGYKEYCKKTRYRLIPFIW